ncbi:MAG: DUF4349 domain-containing protein [Ruminococcaceae bacterium]|nr:DUF4349 domain-containing protein [Oscillospiraceae bacterium]
MKKMIAIFMILCLSLILFTSCDNRDAMMGNTSEKAPTDILDPDFSYSGEDEKDSVVKDETEELRKIIKTYNLSLETKQFKEDSTFIASEAEKLGGYIASSSFSSMSNNAASSQSARYTIRVPSQSVDSYVALISEHCNVITSNLTTEDITDSYYGIQAQIDSLVIQEKNLIEMLEKADNLYDMIALDDKLSEIRAKINELNYKLQNMDKSANYSYVYISLKEVAEYQTSEKTYWQKFGEAVVDSMKNFTDVLGTILIVFVWVFPFVAVIAAIAVTIVIATNRSKRKKQEKRKDSKDQ